MKLILGSSSPRRREILETLRIPFTIRTADTDESCSEADPAARVSTIAAGKCAAVLDLLKSEGTLDDDVMILTADTLVTLDGLFLGKPSDREDAARMAALLQGRTHTVASGICVYYRGKTVCAAELTDVSFAPMTEEEIDAYVASGESFGKAGGYAIQGLAARYITGIRGDYFNVVGLPVRRFYQTVKESFGITL